MRISRELEISLALAVSEARRRRHEFLCIEHVLYALRGESLQDNAAAYGELQAALARMREKPLRLESVEYRMRPEVKNKERRKPWHA